MFDMTAPNDDGIPILLMTANVGSLFEDPDRLLYPWVEEFIRTVSKDAIAVKFLALHLQEVGGKTYEKSMEFVEEFIRKLCEADELRDYNVIRIFMDEDFKSAEHFTALGNLYFLHKSIAEPKIWNFLTHDWEKAEGKNVYTGNIETIATKEKAKFPQHFFPECKWSRKGYMRTRWEIDGTVFDLVNIHLFHDASNLAACEDFPSVYCKTRRKALVHTLERFHTDEKNILVPYFLFGDFNFRCDTEGVIKELTENLTAHRIQNSKNDSTKVHYRNSLGDNVLTVGKKEFNHADHQLKFKESWLKKFDRELEILNEVLVEYPIQFPPSYPYEEDPEMPTDYMSTRCPAWCDRILMSPHAKEIIIDEETNIFYGMIGENICMGDHKPIYLNVHLKRNQGTYRCCRCYLTSANNNNNNSKNDQSSSNQDFSSNNYENNTFCPYQSQAYNEILSECKNLIKNHYLQQQIVSDVNEVHYPLPGHNLPSQDITAINIIRTDDKCPISINIIDSDNSYVCMCAQIATINNSVDGVDGSICPQCKNIIKKKTMEHRYRLISKRLVLSDDIIVNRIDTQYLNANLDTSGRRDPYTPESVDSHSPCPELNSSISTTSSSYSRSPYDQALTIAQQNNQINNEKIANPSYQLLPSKENHQRGVVTPGQLLSRLEDLQRNSMHNTSTENNESVADTCNSYLPYNDDNNNNNSGGVVGICKSCLPRCCHLQ